MFSCGFRETFKNSFSYRKPLVAASIKRKRDMVAFWKFQENGDRFLIFAEEVEVHLEKLESDTLLYHNSFRLGRSAVQKIH